MKDTHRHSRDVNKGEKTVGLVSQGPIIVKID